MKTILFFSSIDRRCFNEQLDGIFRYPRAKNWKVQILELKSAADIRSSMEFWKPSGVIAECGDVQELAPAMFGGVPTVLIDIGKRTPPAGFSVVSLDSGCVGRMGAEHLLGLNLMSYAYAGFTRSALWDDERRMAFAGAVRRAGFICAEFPGTRRLTSTERHRRLCSWIRALPKPCGLMACNDSVGEEVLNICSRIGIRVPEDIAVLGVDNDETLCDNTSPPLASIDPGSFQGGVIIARLLDGMMERGTGCGLSVTIETYPPIRIIVRQSVRRLACDRPKVTEALEMIRRRAYEGIGVGDVVAEMGVSRRVAEKHFRSATGKSILEEILDRRFVRVFELLRDPRRQIGAIAGMCGFATDVALRKAFRLREGMSMSAWRERATHT